MNEPMRLSPSPAEIDYRERLGAGSAMPELPTGELHLLRRIARLASAHLANPSEPNHTRQLAELLAEHLELRRRHA